MSEFSMARAKRSGLPSFLLSDLFKFCFFALSHPLYFSYFIFFSPYLFKIFSFLSPLFITTTLLLLAFLTTLSPGFVQENDGADDLSEHKAGFLTFTYQAVLERLSSKVDDNEEEFQHFEELDEVFKIVFETSTLESVGENPADLLEEVVKETCLEAYETPVDKCSILELNKEDEEEEEDRYVDFEKTPVEITQKELVKWCLEEEKELEKFSYKNEDKEVKPWRGVESDKVDPKPEEKEDEEEEDRYVDFEKTPVEITQKEMVEPTMGVETTLKWCLEEETELEKLSYKNEDKEVNPWGVESDKVDPKPEEKEEQFTRNESKNISTATANNYFAGPDHDFDDQNSLKTNVEEEDSQTLATNLGSFGSLRREKEWRRTLACKLFEERHNVDGGGEGMDMLWETYEAESDKKIQAKNSIVKKHGKKGVLEYSDDDDDDEYEDETDGPLCCLQALKFSAGKMNLGMGRPNLVKISKALKGMGWLTRHGKKKSN
ncbi:uncharacterized protein LOC133782603 [Humulus lupulus]|uniref:uncharacterized protein LOC133782603 n=1 Tax=Humulus lupulus TaxID=3486 RepID=UPI002B4044D6|nr:uncharacterized protein LOC133782603 [Humulus lupulus]